MAKDFSSAINEIMPLVKDGDKSTPFIIRRNPDDAKSPWVVEYPYPAEEAGEVYKQRLGNDPRAVIYRGADFDSGSFSYVHDKILSQILRNEYYEIAHTGVDDTEYNALINFFEDNVGSFSQEATAYLTSLDNPFAELKKLCPFNMATNYEDWRYNESLAMDAVDHIERKIEDIINPPEEDLAYINKQTQRDMEAALESGVFSDDRDFSDEKSNPYDPTHTISSLLLDGIEIELGEDTEHELPFYVESNRGYENLFSFRTSDYAEALKTYSEQVHIRIYDLSIDRQNEAVLQGVDYVKLSEAECLPGSDNENFTGKLIIVNANELLPEYRSSTSQLVECTHGNGARPNAKGTSVFGKELFTGASVVYGRHQILGIADEEMLPQWAKNKLEIQRDDSIFKFGSFHFKPYRDFKYGETDRQLEGDSRLWKTDAHYAMRNMSSDRSLGVSSYDWGNTDYSHQMFYEAAKGSKADIFQCVENGKLYVPCANELFLYSEPSEKELRVAENKALKEYGNVIDAAIQEGVEQKSVPHSLEVLDARFGKDRTNELLAAIALTSLKNDGRISDSRREWAKSVVGDADLKTICVKAHPAHFDNLMMCAVQRDKPEQAKSVPKTEKPDMLAKINGNKQKVEQDKAAAADAPAKKKNRDGQEV